MVKYKFFAEHDDTVASEHVAGYAYAATVNNGQQCIPSKMVTHSWRNKFTFLLAALIADALNNEKYDHIAQLLSTRQFGKLVHALSRASKLDAAYWICAFSVNQHTGICATPPPTDSTGQAISPCSCSVPKHFDGDLSEAWSNEWNVFVSHRISLGPGRLSCSQQLVPQRVALPQEMNKFDDMMAFLKRVLRQRGQARCV